MKKFLFTCFLALPCLFGSTFSAQSQVAESPPESPLHRSAVPVSPQSGDPHRGEETLSDTFTQVANEAENSSHSIYTTSLSTLDGGPTLRTLVLSPVEASDIGHRTSGIKLNFGLVDSDQDMRAGEEAFSLQSAPFPVFASKGKNAKHGTYASNDTNLRSTLASMGGKLDGSAIRQEEQEFTFVPNLLSSHPSSHLDSSFLFLRVEIESSQANPSQQVSITLSSQELDARHEYLLQVEDSMILSPGEFLEGAKGLQIGESKIPLQTGFGRLRIKMGNQSMLQDIWVQPNDSLRVTLDPRTGKLLFLGPHKNKFRLQVQLQDLASAWIKSINPIMLTSNKERLLDSPEKRTHYQTLSDNQALGWNRKLELLTEDSERLGRARFLLIGTREDHPVFEELKRYREDLEPDFYNWLWLYWKGKLRKHALDFMVLTQANSPEWGQQLLEYGLEEEELKRIRALEEFPMEFAEALYIENFLLEIYSGIPFADLTETLPVDLKNQVNAFFLVRQYKELAAPDSLISELIEKTANSWVRNYLQGLLTANLRGSEFINEPFWNERGESVYPESWKGKLVFLDFWLSGCGACMAFAKNKFHPLLEEFGTHPDILFVTITGDSDMELWKTSLSKNLFTTASAQNLYAAGITHPALKQYHIQAFPEQMLLDKEGRILQVGGFPSDLDGWRQLLQTYLTQDTLSNQVLTQPQTN